MSGDARSASPLLRLRGVSKSFNGVAAVKHVDLDLYPGEIVGLVGDNGAGKSTLIKILSGVHKPESGRLSVGGSDVDLKRHSVGRARSLGIETVFQDRSFGEKQPLWRNIFLGRPITNRMGLINVREQKRIALQILNEYVGLRGEGVSADALVRHLSGGERQGLAIGRAMYFNSKIIILDEPTTALSLGEVDKVLDFVGRAVSRDKGCIYISHNMAHVYRVADRIVMMDRGRIAGEYIKQDLTIEELGNRLMHIRSGIEAS